jgi:hypothetical protein
MERVACSARTTRRTPRIPGGRRGRASAEILAQTYDGVAAIALVLALGPIPAHAATPREVANGRSVGRRARGMTTEV